MGDTNSGFSDSFTQVPLIPCEKLTGSSNYNIWAGAVKMWFHGQGYEDHLTTKVDVVSAAKLTKWKKTDASLCTVLWFSIAPNLQAQYQTFSTCYEVWENAKIVFSNDVHYLYSVIHKINTLKVENMDMQAYLSKLDALKANFATLMPYAKDATAHAEQQSKFFMIMALIGLPSEFEFVRNQILSGTTVPNYDAVSEQLLRLSFASLGNNQNRFRGGSSNSKPRPKCDHCNRLGHTIDRCWKLHGRPLRQVNAAQIDHPDTLQTSPSLQNSTPSYGDFFKWGQANQNSGSTVSVAHTGNSSVCFSHSSPLGPWILDSGEPDHVTGNKGLFYSLYTSGFLPSITVSNGSQT